MRAWRRRDDVMRPGLLGAGRSVVVACGLAASAWSAHAQEGTLGFQPRLSMTQTWTDNNGGQAGAKDAALITVIAPGFSMHSNTGRIRGSLDYSLNGVMYMKTAQGDQLQHALSAQGVAELVDRFLFVDVSANISQQVISALGRQTPDNTFSNNNRTPVASLSVSPHLSGTVGGAIGYELRGNLTQSHAKDTTAGNARSANLSARISGAGASKVGWWVGVSAQKSNFMNIGSNQNASTNAGLSYSPDVDWTLGVNTGRELSDLLGNGNANTATYGANASWTPTPRTTVSGDWQKHAYGNSHTLSFDHRMARSSWRYSDTQSVSQGFGVASVGIGTNYELLSLQWLSRYPDPIERDLRVRAALAALGLSPDAIVTSGFLISGPTLMRQRSLSFSLQGGPHTTMTAAFNESSSSGIGVTQQTGDLSQSSQIVQRGMSISIGHQLTPITSASVNLSEQKSRGDQASQSTTMRSISASWSSKLGTRTLISLSARHSSFEGTSPYTDNSVSANLVQQF